MRAPLIWLADHCDAGLPAAALATRLAMTGTEVERVSHHGVGAHERFVVGKVLSVKRHPDADRLTVCEVDVGEAEQTQIVCGAPNVAAGQTVAVARPGAVMPDGTKLREAKLRGVVSHGMILAEDEVAIGTDHDGIMVLDDTLVAGSPLADALPLATEVLELEITPNRPDCLSIYGVAREVHAATGAPLGPPPWSGDPGSFGPLAGVSVEVSDPDLCPRFTARLFEEVTVGPSPPWLKARLSAAGQRPISNVVDVTNYVMLLCGQPLHAFDHDLVAGGALIVRRARAGEQLETLDGVLRSFDSETMLVCDSDGPSGIAGIMGGARSEVSETTTRVLMEAATWVGPNVLRSSTRLGLRSEASTRFEKQLQPEQALDGQALACKLMIELCGAQIVPGTIDVGGPGPEPATIRLRERRVAGLLGVAIGRERCAEILRALEFEVADAQDGLDVRVPSFRRDDVTREADLIEEVARIAGLENIPATLPARRGAVGHLTGAQQLRRRAEDALAACGLHEAVGWSFTSPDVAERLRLPAGARGRRMLRLANPMSQEQSAMRTTLLSSLLDVARHNLSRGATNVACFESGATYLSNGADELPAEFHALGALLCGSLRPASWRAPQPPEADFFAAKGVLAALLGTLRVPWSVLAAGTPFLHPGRAAAVIVGDAEIGWLGELHPLVAREWDLERPVAAFEVDLGRVIAAAPEVPLYEDLTSFPEVREDLAVVVAESVAAEDVLAVVRRAGGRLLADTAVFDVYRGAQVGEGQLSLALRLVFRAADRTLTDVEVAALRAEILAALADELGALQRA